MSDPTSVHNNVTINKDRATDIVVAATRLHDALYYGSKDVVLGLPSSVALAYMHLQQALGVTRSHMVRPPVIDEIDENR